MSEFRFPRHLVLAGAPFDARPAALPEVRSFQEALLLLLDLAMDGSLTKGDVKLHWFEQVDELIRELRSLAPFVGSDPKSVAFVLFSTPGASSIQLQRKVNSLELSHEYVASPKLLVYSPHEWQTVAALARRSSESRTFIIPHVRQHDIIGPGLFAVQVRNAYDSGDIEGLRDYLASEPERATEPPPAPRKERDDATIQYPNPDRPSQLMKALPPEPDGRASDPNATTQEIPMDVIQRATRPK